MDTRIGFGYDSHVFKPGVPLRIGGLTLDHPEGLAGHSDGDVLLHAITDALLGAVAAGDIVPPGCRISKRRTWTGWFYRTFSSEHAAPEPIK